MLWLRRGVQLAVVAQESRQGARHDTSALRLNNGTLVGQLGGTQKVGKERRRRHGGRRSQQSCQWWGQRAGSWYRSGKIDSRLWLCRSHGRGESQCGEQCLLSRLFGRFHVRERERLANGVKVRLILRVGNLTTSVAALGHELAQVTHSYQHRGELQTEERQFELEA